MNRKKVLILHPALAPYRVDFFNSLNEHFDAKFYFFNDNLLNQKFDQDKLKEVINFKCLYLKKGFNFKGRSFRFNTRKIISDFKPDIIIVPEYNLISLSVLVNRLFLQKKFKIVNICDDSVQVAEGVSFFKKKIRAFLLKKLDGIILTHKEIEKWYSLNLKPKAKLLTFPIIRKETLFLNQLEDSKIIAKQYHEDYNLNNKEILLFVGRLVEVKNIERLIDAFKTVKEKRKDCILIIVGSGEKKAELNNKIKNLNLNDSIILPGRFEGQNLLAWFYLSNLFILPSISETFGAVVNEALLSNCYTLCSELAGASSLIENDTNGNIFNPYDINEMAKVILSGFKKSKLLHNNKLDDNYMLVTYDSVLKKMIKQLYEI